MLKIFFNYYVAPRYIHNSQYYMIFVCFCPRPRYQFTSEVSEQPLRPTTEPEIVF